MIAIKNVVIGLSLTLLATNCLAQQVKFSENLNDSNLTSNEMMLNNVDLKILNFKEDLLSQNGVSHINEMQTDFSSKRFELHSNLKASNQQNTNNEIQDLKFSSIKKNKPESYLNLPNEEKEPFFKNRRNVYSSLWAFASLNYLYADLVGVMDKNKLVQYQTGVVEGVKITPEFLTISAGFMQTALANVFLPHIIKNEKTLRWVQIASGTIMTLVQSGTLFAGKPTPYYALFSAFEIAATTYITIDAIRWKPKSKKKIVLD